MAKLAHTSESVIHVGFIVLNLEKWLQKESLSQVCVYMFKLLREIKSVLGAAQVRNSAKVNFS